MKPLMSYGFWGSKQNRESFMKRVKERVEFDQEIYKLRCEGLYDGPPGPTGPQGPINPPAPQASAPPSGPRP